MVVCMFHNSLHLSTYETMIKTKLTKKGLVSYQLILDNREFPIALWTMNKDWQLEMRRDPDKHFFVKWRSYGFNPDFLKMFDDDQPIILKLVKRKEKYLLTPRLITDKWHYLHFLQQGYEKQLFVPLEEITKNEITKTRTVDDILSDMKKKKEEINIFEQADQQ